MLVFLKELERGGEKDVKKKYRREKRERDRKKMNGERDETEM